MANLVSVNPYTGEKVKEYPLHTFEAVKKKLDQSAEVQKKWAQKDLSERVRLVSGALSYFETHRDQIARDISVQMGRPFTQAKGEISGLLQRAKYMCEIADKTLSPEVIEDSENFYRAIEHSPLGTVFVISAWNYPLLITINSVIPGLIAGNSILLKHSSLTPEIGLHFERAFNHLGDGEGLLQNLIIDHETTGRIIEELPIHHVIFTGSVAGGQQILKHTSKKFITPQLELGGKDAAFVNSDADLDHAADSIVDGAMFNSGQSCCGIERAYVHEKIFDEFIKKAQTLIEAYVLGDPMEAKTNLGPQANPKSIDLMLRQIDEAKTKGARVLAGGQDQRLGQARFMKPSLLVDVDHKMEIIQEENFGPILPVIKVKDMQAATELINDSKYGLTCAIFTKNLDSANEFARRVNTGTVFMNRCDYLDPALPWTGVKDSGCGSSLSKYGFYGLTRRKSVHFKKKI